MTAQHGPAPIEMMSHVSPKFTICEVVRQIYHEAVRIGSEDIQLKARIALSMGKAMDTKLRTYNKAWKIDFFDNNESRG